MFNQTYVETPTWEYMLFTMKVTAVKRVDNEVKID